MNIINNVILKISIFKYLLFVLNILLFTNNCYSQIETNINETEISDSSNIISNNQKSLTIKSLQLKNPETAFFVAIIPGVIFRGAGHFYAGRNVEGTIIFITSTTTFLLFYPGVLILDYPESIMDLFVIISLGTWIYDIIASPIICKRDNEKKIKSLSVNQYINKNLFGNQIGLKICYRF